MNSKKQNDDEIFLIRELNKKISALKKEGEELQTKVLERREWLGKVAKIVVGGKNDLVVVYKVD